LVVHAGRFAGVRRPLTAPVTLLGQAPHCDVRLHAEGVGEVHLALAAGPGAVHLRNLGGAGETLVNGAPFTTGPLGPGDVITVGPFSFRVEAASPPDSEPAPTQEGLEVERDALRIQAAAVVAQQAALAEQEAHLRQRHTALGRQKEQLAAHLDKRRRHLLELQEQTRQDRADLKAAAEAARQEAEQERRQLAQANVEADQARQEIDRQRRRLVELRKRLKQRWHRHWDGEKAGMAARERELAGGWEKVRADSAALDRERAHLLQERLRFNGEAELGRRRMQDEWQQLGLAQQQWEAALNQEQQRREQQRRELEKREAAVAAVERALADRQRQAEQRLAHLGADLVGLEERARNQRLKLFEQEQQSARAGLALQGPGVAGGEIPEAIPVPAGALVAVPVRPSVRRFDLPAVWGRLAGVLADQRRHLLEQWQRLLELHLAWGIEHNAVLEAVEAAARALAQREERLRAWEQELQAQGQAAGAGELELRQRQQELSEVRVGLEGWQARLTAREAAWEAERTALLTQVRAREEAAAAQVERLEELRQRRLRRRGDELEAVRQARARCEELRKDYAALWQEYQERRAQLAQEQRELAARSLALEHLRQDLLARAPDPAALGRRLEKLERRHRVRLEAEEKALAEERRVLVAEGLRLEERARHLRQQEDDLIARHEEWARQQAEWEEERQEAAEVEVRRRQEVEHLRARHDVDERQLGQLREEVERIARLLIDEPEPAPALPPPASQAA
jgi:hypothetical protein